jgi:nucleoid-associated protein YgaU
VITNLSRYSAQSETRNGDTVVVAVRGKTTTPDYITHVSREGDSFESLAARYLGAAIFYWRIADINPQVIFPDMIPVGTTIRIPQ